MVNDELDEEEHLLKVWEQLEENSFGGLQNTKRLVLRTLLGTGTDFFSRNIYCYIWIDAAWRADSEYHFGFAEKYLRILKTNDSGAEAWFFKKPLTPFLFTGTIRRYRQR